MDTFEVESVCWDDVSADDFDVAGGKASQSGENMASVSGGHQLESDWSILYFHLL